MKSGQEYLQRKLDKGNNKYMEDRKKSILYVRADGIYYDSRATKEIKALLGAGYKLLVLGWDRDGKAETKCESDFKSYGSQIEFNLYHGTIQGSASHGLKHLWGWLRFVRAEIKRLKDNVIAVHACDLDTLLLSYRLIKKYSLSLVYDVYDYYVDSHYYLPKLLKFFLERIEINIINTADVTIICTEERMEQLEKAKPRKVVVVHNSPDVVYLKNESLYDYFYCGSLCDSRLLKETFSEYAKNTDLKVCIGGFGTYEKDVKEVAEKYDNFIYLGPISYSDCLINESKSLCLSAIYEPSIRNHRLCAPNKFYESLALGKPVIVCKGTGIDKIVSDNNIGVVIDYDAAQFYSAVRRLASNPQLCEEMGKRARKLYDEKYNWGIMSKRLLEIYSNL